MLYLQEVSKKEYQNYRASGSVSLSPETKKHSIFSDLFPLRQSTPIRKFCLIYLYSDPDPIIIGLVSYNHMTGRSLKRSKLLEIEIFTKHQNRGHGLRVMNIILDEALEFGSSFVSLVVFNHNGRAKKFYRKLGFSIWKEFQSASSMIKFLDRDV
ncbi:MAG: GNAT family N-acetyltransferase [Candidatus Kariarchaeaceae archaeon]